MDAPAGERSAEVPGLTGSSGRRNNEKDRRCSVCGTRLSIYNTGPNCWQHTIGWPWRGPAARPRYR